LRYTSELADAGPNDMQILWFNAVGPNEEALAEARVIGAVMRVFSHGEVRLQSEDPRADPIVEFRMLSDQRDLVRLRDAVRRIIAIVRNPAIASIADGIVALSTPIDELESDAAIDEWLRTTVNDYVHAVGTCRMGSRGDPAAVVDTDCNVIGYAALRVCDASVMPDLPRANTHLTTVVLAERVIDRAR
jgi:5-(hydroxymethyl)furfural/furfural oxidase